MQRDRWLRALLVLLVIIASLHLAGVIWDVGQRFGDIIVIFFLAWLLSFVLTPVTHALEQELSLPRALAAAGVYFVLFLGLLGTLLLIVPTLIVQLAELGKVLPQYAEQVPIGLNQLQQDLADRNIDVDLTSLYRPQDLTASLTGLGSTAVQNLVAILTGVVNVIIAAFIVFVLSFYMVVDGDLIEESMLQFVPDNRRGEIDFFLSSVNRTFGGFLRGTLIQAVIYGLGTAAVMVVAGLDFVLVASLFAGIVMVIPIFGPFLAIVPPVLVALMSAPGQTLLLVVAGLLVLQQVTFNVIAPKVMSENLGMHPLLVFAALLIGGRLAGIAGAIFGVPIAAVLWAMLRQVLSHSRYGQLASERSAAANEARRQRALERARAIAAGEIIPRPLSRLRDSLVRFAWRSRSNRLGQQVDHVPSRHEP